MVWRGGCFVHIGVISCFKPSTRKPSKLVTPEPPHNLLLKGRSSRLCPISTTKSAVPSETPPLPRTCVKLALFVLLAFFPNLVVCGSNLEMRPWKRRVLSVGLCKALKSGPEREQGRSPSWQGDVSPEIPSCSGKSCMLAEPHSSAVSLLQWLSLCQEWLHRHCMYVCMYVCMYIHIYAVVLLSGPSLGVLNVTIWSKFVFIKHQLSKQHYKNRGFSPFFEKQIARKKIKCYYLVQVDAF